jgi:hypothetical protein
VATRIHRRRGGVDKSGYDSHGNRTRYAHWRLVLAAWNDIWSVFDICKNLYDEQSIADEMREENRRRVLGE